MKLNKQITSESEKIYDEIVARKLYLSKEYGHRQLSLMKQENIRIAIKKGISLSDLYDSSAEFCGYCFKYLDEGKIIRCRKCPFYKDGMNCYNYSNLEKVTTIKKFADLHKRWCKKLKLWNNNWR